MVKLVGQVEVVVADLGLRAVLGINLTQRHTMGMDMVMMVVMETRTLNILVAVAVEQVVLEQQEALPRRSVEQVVLVYK
jgi:hypothetical protein|tara:strand:- start:327 stop:563 length:237 start_codon:yes stop_codon:yes gene_type:complete